MWTPPYKRKWWTNSRGPVVHSLLWGWTKHRCLIMLMFTSIQSSEMAFSNLFEKLSTVGRWKLQVSISWTASWSRDGSTSRRATRLATVLAELRRREKLVELLLTSLLLIRDVYPGSQIQDQKGSRIRFHVKEFKYFNPKNMFLSSR
jgi:hypothetical protein